LETVTSAILNLVSLLQVRSHAWSSMNDATHDAVVSQCLFQ
jgi:hypothetical protein